MTTAMQANVERTLINMPIGKTRGVYNSTVTRWSKDVFEVGTWGRNTVGFIQAVEMIAEAYRD